MIDNVAYGLKIVFFLVGFYQLYRLRICCIPLLAVPLFMTGVEIIHAGGGDTWAYLFSTNAIREDYEKAIFGGTLFTMLPILLFIFCGKDLANLLDSGKSTIHKSNHTD